MRRSASQSHAPEGAGRLGQLALGGKPGGGLRRGAEEGDAGERSGGARPRRQPPVQHGAQRVRGQDADGDGQRDGGQQQAPVLRPSRLADVNE